IPHAPRRRGRRGGRRSGAGVRRRPPSAGSRARREPGALPPRLRDVKPRLLVLRSGGRPFPGELAPGLEVVDRSTHEIEALEPDGRALDGRVDFVIVTSRTAVEQLVANESLRARL